LLLFLKQQKIKRTLTVGQFAFFTTAKKIKRTITVLEQFASFFTTAKNKEDTHRTRTICFLFLQQQKKEDTHRTFHKKFYKVKIWIAKLQKSIIFVSQVK
jgi:hypothetical protein